MINPKVYFFYSIKSVIFTYNKLTTHEYIIKQQGNSISYNNINYVYNNTDLR
jgi:hypothetical protein